MPGIRLNLTKNSSSALCEPVNFVIYTLIELLQGLNKVTFLAQGLTYHRQSINFKFLSSFPYKLKNNNNKRV